MIFSKVKYYLIISILAISFAGCNDNEISSIPDYPVSLNLNLTTTYPTFMNSYNKFLLFEKPVFATDMIGYGGILVNTGFDGNYYAFDMSCPYEAKQTIRVIPNGLGQAVCQGCGSVFNIGYGIGDPSSGPAKQALKRYKATLIGDVLEITAR
jgi:nitrite reductase/ring-hydroxylating ferredoxin subunit